MMLVFIYILILWFCNAVGTAIDRSLGRWVDPFLSIFARMFSLIGGLDLRCILASSGFRLIKFGWSRLFLILV